MAITVWQAEVSLPERLPAESTKTWIDSQAFSSYQLHDREPREEIMVEKFQRGKNEELKHLHIVCITGPHVQIILGERAKLGIFSFQCNAGPAAFWLLGFLLTHPEAMEAVRSEVGHLISQDTHRQHPPTDLLEAHSTPVLGTQQLLAALFTSSLDTWTPRRLGLASALGWRQRLIWPVEYHRIRALKQCQRQ